MFFELNNLWMPCLLLSLLAKYCISPPHFLTLQGVLSLILLYEYSTQTWLSNILKRAGFSVFTQPCPCGKTCRILVSKRERRLTAVNAYGTRFVGAVEASELQKRGALLTLTDYFEGCSTFPTHCNGVSSERSTSRLCTKAATWKKKNTGRRKNRLYFSNRFFRLNLEMWLGTDQASGFFPEGSQPQTPSAACWRGPGAQPGGGAEIAAPTGKAPRLAREKLCKKTLSH